MKNLNDVLRLFFLLIVENRVREIKMKHRLSKSTPWVLWCLINMQYRLVLKSRNTKNQTKDFCLRAIMPINNTY